MKSLFEAILLIVVFTGFFLLYYFSKEWLNNFKSYRKSRHFSNIIKAERLAHNRRILKVALTKLSSDQAFWAEIYFHNQERERARLECRPGQNELYFLFEEKLIEPQIILNLEKYGNLIATKKNVIRGFSNKNTDQLMEGIFYYFDKISGIDIDTEIKIKY